MYKKFFILAVAVMSLSPAFAADRASPATQVECAQRIENALREYDKYERQDAETVKIPVEDWRCMHQQMQEMRMYKNQMHMENGTMHHMRQQSLMPMHNHFNR